MKLPLLLATVAILGGCSSREAVEVQNDGPGPATVTLRYKDDGRDVERVVEVPERSTMMQSLWYGAEPKSLEVEAKWANSVRRQTFTGKGLIEGLQRSVSGSKYHGLAVSPDGIQWVQPSLWIRLQNPALIPGILLIFVFGLSRWIRWRMRSASPSAAPR